MATAPVKIDLISVIESIYDAAPDPSKWPRALGAIADFFGDAGALFFWTKDDGSFGTIVSESLQSGQKDYEEGNWSKQDIRGQRSVERGYFFSGEPFTDRHLCSEQEMREHPCYTEFLARHNLGFVAAIAVSPDPHIGVLLCIQRNAKILPPFSDDELRVLGRLGPHVEKSLRLSVRLLDAELTNAGLGNALAKIGIGVFALDSKGRAVFSNEAGQRQLGAPLEVVNGRLAIGSGANRREIADRLSGMLSGQPIDQLSNTQPILLRNKQTDHPLVVYLLPIPASKRNKSDFLSNARAIVLLMEQKIDDPADPAVVRDILGLTLGEARVAALIGSGLGPRQAADKLGIAEDTARNVLKKVFAKTGVARQSELVALLSKLVMR